MGAERCISWAAGGGHEGPGGHVPRERWGRGVAEPRRKAVGPEAAAEKTLTLGLGQNPGLGQTCSAFRCWLWLPRGGVNRRGSPGVCLRKQKTELGDGTDWWWPGEGVARELCVLGL